MTEKCTHGPSPAANVLKNSTLVLYYYFMMELIISALLGIITGVLSLIVAIKIALGGVAGGDIWHPDWSSGLWWVAPILLLAVDVVLLLFIQKYSNLQFATGSYAVMVACYLAAVIIALLLLR